MKDQTPLQTANDWKTLDINNLFNKLVSYNYQASKFSGKATQFQDDICRLFQSLLWAQKNNPEMLFTLFDMHSLEQVQQRHLEHSQHFFLKNYILVMMNSCEGGLLADLLLQHKLPHFVLKSYLNASRLDEENDEVLEYVGSFLKAYHRIFHPHKLAQFILNENYFELLQVSFKFFNCPEPLTNTTVFNIVLALLKHKEVKQFILNNQSRKQFYQNILDELTKLLRNQLAEFGLRIKHFSKNDDVEFIMGEIDDKITLWEDISEAAEGLQDIFQLPFSKNVLLPILIGPLLKATQIPLFTLKFSLFLIRKLFPVINNLGMLQILLRMMLIENNVYFWPTQLHKAKVKPFKFSVLLCQEIQENEEEEKESYSDGIKQFYQGLFRSKDNHFILITTSLISSISRYLPKYPMMAKQCKLNPGAPIQLWLTEVLVNQLAESHCLNTLASIINTLILLGQGNKLEQDLQNRYNFIFRNLITQAYNSVKNHTRHWDSLIQTNEYDINYVERIELGKEICQKQYEELFKIVFTWDSEKEESSCSSFYSCIPDTPLDHVRYLLVKFLLLRRGCTMLLDGISFPDLVADYFSKIIIKSAFIQGDTYRLAQIKQNIVECQIIQEKETFPAIWIKDDDFFVIAYLEKAKKQAQILTAVKYKNITCQQEQKKDRVMLLLHTRYWHPENSRMVQRQHVIKFKGLQTAFPAISHHQCISREKELSFITRAFKKTEQNLPSISLI